MLVVVNNLDGIVIKGDLSTVNHSNDWNPALSYNR